MILHCRRALRQPSLHSRRETAIRCALPRASRRPNVLCASQSAKFDRNTMPCRVFLPLPSQGQASTSSSYHSQARLVLSRSAELESKETVNAREKMLHSDTSMERTTMHRPIDNEKGERHGDENGGRHAVANEGSINDIVTGNLYLLIVSVLWGSYSPALKGLFMLPGAPSPLVVAAARGGLQAALLAVPVVLTGFVLRKKEGGQEKRAIADDGELGETNNFWLYSPAILGSLEIGCYNTLGTLCQTWGLSLSSATRSAFLVQATALWTPMLSAMFGMSPTPLLWLSSFVALASTLFVTLDQVQLGDAASLNTITTGMESLMTGASLGDVTILASAFFYSLSTVRIPHYASRVPPVQLAFGKSVVLACVALSSLGFVLLQDSTARGFSSSSLLEAWYDVWPGASWHENTAFALLLWSAVGPGALSAFLHVKGQSIVSPTDAQVVFATIPLWSALLAALFLPGEKVGTLTWVGGGGMLMAGLIAALGSMEPKETDSDAIPPKKEL